MAFDLQAHYQSIYNAMRTALNADGFTAVPIIHVFSGDSTLITSHEPPMVVYRQDVERQTGTVGAGSLKILRSNWVITSYAIDLADSLDAISTIVDDLTDAALTTTDGYTTTNLAPLGVQSLYEKDGQVFATHLRMEWERSL
jgi:hypothetical protein